MVHNPGGDWNPGQGGQPSVFPYGKKRLRIMNLNDVKICKFFWRSW